MFDVSRMLFNQFITCRVAKWRLISNVHLQLTCVLIFGGTRASASTVDFDEVMQVVPKTYDEAGVRLGAHEILPSVRLKAVWRNTESSPFADDELALFDQCVDLSLLGETAVESLAKTGRFAGRRFFVARDKKLMTLHAWAPDLELPGVWLDPNQQYWDSEEPDGFADFDKALTECVRDKIASRPWPSTIAKKAIGSFELMMQVDLVATRRNVIASMPGCSSGRLNLEDLCHFQTFDPMLAPEDIGTTAHVEVGDPLLLGPINASDIHDAVEPHMDKIKYCYEREVRKLPSLFGKVAISLNIESDGAVSRAATKTSSLKSRVVESCLASRLKRIQFPPLTGGSLRLVTYYLSFSATTKHFWVETGFTRHHVIGDRYWEQGQLYAKKPSDQHQVADGLNLGEQKRAALLRETCDDGSIAYWRLRNHHILWSYENGLEDWAVLLRKEVIEGPNRRITNWNYDDGDLSARRLYFLGDQQAWVASYDKAGRLEQVLFAVPNPNGDVPSASIGGGHSSGVGGLGTRDHVYPMKFDRSTIEGWVLVEGRTFHPDGSEECTTRYGDPESSVPFGTLIGSRKYSEMLPPPHGLEVCRDLTGQIVHRGRYERIDHPLRSSQRVGRWQIRQNDGAMGVEVYINGQSSSARTYSLVHADVGEGTTVASLAEMSGDSQVMVAVRLLAEGEALGTPVYARALAEFRNPYCSGPWKQAGANPQLRDKAVAASCSGWAGEYWFDSSVSNQVFRIESDEQCVRLLQRVCGGF